MNSRYAPLFANVSDWIFDLDNCLYPASTGLFELIDERMGGYIERLLGCDRAEAKRVQKAHFHVHGTTLAGLMREHDVDPHHFLEDVHAIPLDRIPRDERLAVGLARLPGHRDDGVDGARLSGARGGGPQRPAGGTRASGQPSRSRSSSQRRCAP